MKPSRLRPSFALPQLYRNVAWSFFVVTLVFVLIVVYLTVTSAHIVVTVKTNVFPVDFLVKVRTDYRSPGVHEESSLASRFVERQGEKRASFPTTSKEDVPDRAGGTMTIKNTTATAQPLVVRTRFLSQDGVLFRIQKNVVVPASGSADVAVLADEPGRKGEVVAGRFTIPGLSKDLQEKIYGETSVAMTGGTQKAFSLTADDVNRAKEELGKQLEEELRTALSRDRTEHEYLVTQHEVLLATVDESLGSSKEQFSLLVQGRVSGVLIDQRELLELARKKLGEAIPAGESFGDVHTDDVTTQLTQLNTKDQTAQLHVAFVANRAPTRSNPLFDPQQFAGKRKNDVLTSIKAIPNVHDVSVQLSPFWFRRLPRVVDHITVDVRKQ